MKWLWAVVVVGLGLVGFVAAYVLTGGFGKSIDEITAQNAELIRAAPQVQAADGDWPWWRGPLWNGKATGPAPPVQWSASENVAWKVDVPGRGHASPIVCGHKVLIATADEHQQTQSLLCFSRDDGSLIWNKVIHNGQLMGLHNDNSHASATPACDGERVFTVFAVDDAIWVSAVDLAGQIVWQTKAGGFRSLHGYGSSPVLYRSLVIVAGDSNNFPFLAGLDRETGEIKWRVGRDKKHSFATPIVADVAGREQLLMSGQGDVVSYDPASGEELWRVSGSTRSTANTMAWNDELVFAGGGYPDSYVIAVRADGSGDVVWRNNKKDYVPSPLSLDDKLLVINDDGVAYCYDSSSGDELWKKRLGGGFYASPVMWNDRVYVPNKTGTMFVFEAPDFDLLAENDLSTGGYPTPAICNGQIFIRTDSHLYCITEATQ